MRLSIVLFVSLFVVTAGVQAQDQTDAARGVHALLDRYEQAFGERNDEQYASCFCDELLVVIDPPQSGNAQAADKKTFLESMKNYWEKLNPVSRRIEQRDIQIRFGIAWIRASVVTRFENRPEFRAAVVMAAVERDGQWKICLGLPAMIRSIVLVTDIKPDSQAERLGIHRGAVILRYAGEAVISTLFLDGLLKRHEADGAQAQIELVIEQDGKEKALVVQPGMLGVSLDNRIMPAEGAQLFDHPDSHPLRAMTRDINMALARDDLQKFYDALSEPAFLAIEPKPATGIVILHDRKSIHQILPKQLSQMQEKYDMASFRVDREQVIQQGDVAIVTSRMSIRPKDSTQPLLEQPSVLEVYVLQGQAWRLATLLPMRLEAGTQLPGEIFRSADETAQTERRIAGKISGLGIGIEAVADGVRIKQVMAGHGGEAAGLRVGDVITDVAGRVVAGLSIEEVVQLILGPAGSEVALKVKGADGAIRYVVATRGEIILSNVSGDLVEGDVGVLRVAGFNKETVAEARRVLEDLQSRGATGFVLDLRGEKTAG